MDFIKGFSDVLDSFSNTLPKRNKQLVNEKFLDKFSNEADRKKLDKAVERLRNNPDINSEKISLSNDRSVTIIVD